MDRWPSQSWWWWPNGDHPRQRPVLFFGPSGAEPTAALPLARHTAGLRFGVLQLPGRGSRLDEPAPDDLAELIDAICTSVIALDGPPPVLVGHSFGGLVAYGVALGLQDRGCPAGKLLAVASASPPHWQAQLEADRKQFPDEDLGTFVHRRTDQILGHGGVAPELMAHPEFAARARLLVETDVALSRAGFAVRAVTLPVTCVVARDDTVLAATAVEGWAEIAGARYERREVNGGHFFYRAEPRLLAAQLRLEVQSLDGDYAWQ